MNALADLQVESLATLRHHLRPGSQVALVDYPRHPNSGDSLIWLGEKAYLQRLGVRVRYVSSLHHLSEKQLRRRLAVGSTILIHGGGNLGDRWPEPQRHREQVLNSFPDYRVIQLPQSFEFAEESSIRTANSAFARHPDLLVMLRERQSLKDSRSAFETTSVVFCHDLAVGFGSREMSNVAPRYDIVWLHRTDGEGVTGSTVPSCTSQVTVRETDWGLHTIGRRCAWRALRLPEDIFRVFGRAETPFHFLKSWSFDRMAEVSVSWASSTLASGRVVVTDRLHAMVLSALIGVPVVAYNSSNDKVRRIYEESFAEFDSISYAATLEEAMEVAVSLVRGRHIP